MRTLAFAACVVLLCLAAPALAWTPTPYGPPAVINQSDCPSSFMMDVHHRHNPAELGSVTRDGYPVLLTPKGKPWHIMPQGMPLPDPVRLPGGYPLPDHVPASPTGP